MANRGKTACGTTILGRPEMFGKETDKGIWWTVGVDCGEERHRFLLVDDRLSARPNIFCILPVRISLARGGRNSTLQKSLGLAPLQGASNGWHHSSGTIPIRHHSGVKTGYGEDVR
jgi:hypothetical protein